VLVNAAEAEVALTLVAIVVRAVPELRMEEMVVEVAVVETELEAVTV
jgi:hypothetical protein